MVRLNDQTKNDREKYLTNDMSVYWKVEFPQLEYELSLKDNEVSNHCE